MLAACTSEHCQALVARLQHQLQNLREEKSQLESLIYMQQQTLHQIDQVNSSQRLSFSKKDRSVFGFPIFRPPLAIGAPYGLMLPSFVR